MNTTDTNAQTVIVITGSATGIGRELALQAAQHGSTVIVNSRKRQRLTSLMEDLDQINARYLALEADLTTEEGAETLIQSTVDAFGRVDILVNNAAGLFFSPAETISLNGWRAVMDSCLTTAFLSSKAVYPYLKRQNGGAIWNISSIAAYRPHPGAAHYAAAKAGMNSLTETLAVEWGQVGIQVNGIAFGAIWTENSRFANEVHRHAVERELPGHRIATAMEAAAIALSLINTRSSYLTGETIRVDGGFRGILNNPNLETSSVQ